MSAIRRVWVTRAEPGASRTADRLTALGFEPVVAPLLAIHTIPQAAPDLTGIAALAFTSANGVTAFGALTPDRTRAVFTVGEATAQAARAAGFTAVRSASGDLNRLAALIAKTAPPGGLVLAPGALQPSGDLSALLDGRVTVRTMPVYEALETDVAVPAGCEAVLIHSRRAAAALVGRGTAAHGGRVVVAISAAAAVPLLGASVAEIRVAGAPTETALLAALGKGVPRV